MLYKKFTPGVVEQTFNDTGECIAQKFVVYSHEGVEYETEDGNRINITDIPFMRRGYFPFEMKQPPLDRE